MGAALSDADSGTLCRRPPRRATEQPPALWPKLGGPEPTLNRPLFQILLVEDEPVIQELVRSLLGDTGVEVSCASNGVEGL